MKFIEQYLEEKVLVKPLGNVTTLTDEFCGLSCENIIINGKDTGISVAHCDYADWLETKIGELPRKSQTNDDDTSNLHPEHEYYDYEINKLKIEDAF